MNRQFYVLRNDMKSMKDGDGLNDVLGYARLEEGNQRDGKSTVSVSVSSRNMSSATYCR